MSAAWVLMRLVGKAARGWLWLLRGRFDKTAGVLRELLLLVPPADANPQIGQVREKLIDDLATAALARMRLTVGLGSEAEQMWREVAERLVEEGWDRERVQALLGVGGAG